MWGIGVRHRVCIESPDMVTSCGVQFYSGPNKSDSLDLPLPHGLAPSENHGLNPPLSTEDPRNKGFSGAGAPIFGFGHADPAPKG